MARKQTYENDDIVLTFDPGICAHAGECVRGLPGVFDVDRQPWVDVGGAPAERVLEVVARCPTGALQAQRKAGTAAAGAPEPRCVTITLASDGPLLLAGEVRVVDAGGEIVAQGAKLALCRCGATANAPLCDGSHKRIGYVSPRPKPR